MLEMVLKQKTAIRKEKKVKGYLTELEDVEATLVNKLREINKSFVFLEALAKNTDFNKDAIQEAFKKVEKLIRVQSLVLDNEDEEEPSKPPKKTDTKAVTLELFNQGLSIPEIAQKRDFTVGTIESHLAYYISD